MTDEIKPIEKKPGGNRQGAGRPKGSLNKTTLEALEVKQAYQDRIRRNADKLFNAQFSLATGTQMLFVIHTDSKGIRRKPELVTDPDIITRFLDENEGVDGSMSIENYDDDSKCDDYFFITTKVPDSRTISDMLDRAMGKPDSSIDITSNGETIKGATIEFSNPDIKAEDTSTDLS